MDFGLPCTHPLEETTADSAVALNIELVIDKMSSTGFAWEAKCGICGKLGKNKYETGDNGVRILRSTK